MDKLTINYETVKISFGVDKYKIILGNNYNTKHVIFKMINKVLQKREDSEYCSENSYYNNMKINDQDINLREYKLYQINQFIDLSKEEKLASKSLYVELLESLFNEIEYTELVNTINILNDELSDYMNEELNNIFQGDLQLKVDIDNVSIRTLLKQISMFTFLNDTRSNDIDLTYNQEIILQIKMIEVISKIKYNFKYIVLIDIPFISNEILEEFKRISNTNIKFIIKTERTEKNIISKDILRNIILVNNEVIDLASDIEIYEKITEEFEQMIEIEETKEVVCAYLNDERNEKYHNLKGII